MQAKKARQENTQNFAQHQVGQQQPHQTRLVLKFAAETAKRPSVRHVAILGYN